jgi:hypothetical protein
VVTSEPYLRLGLSILDGAECSCVGGRGGTHEVRGFDNEK